MAEVVVLSTAWLNCSLVLGVIKGENCKFVEDPIETNRCDKISRYLWKSGTFANGVPDLASAPGTGNWFGLPRMAWMLSNIVYASEFWATMAGRPEVMEFYRMSGKVDVFHPPFRWRRSSTRGATTLIAACAVLTRASGCF